MGQMSHQGKVWVTVWVKWVSRERYRYLDGPDRAQGKLRVTGWAK